MFLLWLRQLPWCGHQTPASVPPPAEGRSSPTNTPVFSPVPSSYRVLCSSIYSFLLVRDSCLLSAGVPMHFSVWSVSMERDVLHVHLLLRHLVPLHFLLIDHMFTVSSESIYDYYFWLHNFLGLFSFTLSSYLIHCSSGYRIISFKLRFLWTLNIFIHSFFVFSDSD